MRRLSCFLLTLVAAGAAVQFRTHAQAPADATVYAVAYVDVLPSAKGAMTAALARYRDASRKEDGYLAIDLLEQVGRPGHVVVVEAWRSQQALDAHTAAPHGKELQEALEPIRTSGYDQRPYKTFSVAPAAGASADQSVYVVSHVDIGGPQGEAPALLRSLAEASRKEAGSLRFDILQHSMRVNHYTIVEVWRNQQALDAHAAAPHTKAFRNRLQPMTGSPLDERVLRAIG
jgi:quinol monooxygenase YgiN